MSRQSTFLALSCLLVAASFCCGQNSAEAQVARILGGQETDDFPSVGIVGSQRRGGFCTGTLISSNHVLTAAHCAIEIDGPTTGTFELDGQVFATRDVIIHPNFDPVTFANDIAILELSASVPGIEPSQILRDDPVVGDVLTIVGFGATGTATGGSDGNFGTKRFGFTTVDEVTATLVNWEFDDPTENNTAPGDSGGPGFLDIDGDLFIACITSGGTEPDASLGDMAFNTRVDAYATWIDDVILFSVPPSDDQPSDDEQPTDDPDQMGPSDCHFAGGVGRPFPLLRLLMYLLWALMDLLSDDGVDDAGEMEEPAATESTQPAPSEPAPQPTEPSPEVPVVPTPEVPATEVPTPGDVSPGVTVPETEVSGVGAGGAIGTSGGGAPNQRTRIRRSTSGRLSTGPTWKGRIGH